MLAARALDHRAQTLNVLAVAALLAVAATPVVVLDAGFLLSFGATAGILLGVPLLAPSSPEPRHRLSAARKAGGALRTMLAATVCAELALAPVAATLFGRVSFAGFVLNFAAIPLMSVVQIGGLVIAASASAIAPLALLAARVVHAAALALLASAALVDVAPWLVVDAPPPVWWLTAAYYAALVGLLARRATRYWAVCFALSAALLLAGPRLTARDAVPRSRLPLRVVVLDVGQGDATVVSLPGGTAMLVDTGGFAALSTGADGAEPPAFDVGERVVVPALRALGVTRLESVVITHGDPDHVMGAPGILRHLPPHSIWEGVPVPPHAGLQRLAAWARRARRELAPRAGRRRRALRRCRAARAASAATRLGAPARAERGLGRARAAAGGCLGRAARRYRKRRRARDPPAPRARPDCRPEGPAPRQRDVEHVGAARLPCARRR